MTVMHESLGLTADGVVALRGERLVLRGLSLAVPPGGALVLMGANGSGKSTALRVLAGLKRPDAGGVAWQGRDAMLDPAAYASHVAYLGHLDAVKPALTVAENLWFAASAAGWAAALEGQDLWALRDLPARLLSAGQRRRLALARVVAAARAVWLLDEPTLGLDAAAVGRLGTALATHREAGGVVVAATHVPLPLPDAAELRL